MRLLHTENLSFEEFTNTNLPRYAILSHTWGRDEATFEDLSHPSWNTKEGNGFEKIRRSCRLAQEDRIDYIWIDTCCIDKTSSTELTEAINSMFRWYSASEVCYAYLSDWSPGAEFTELSKCQWFRRGWTLQELIAPRDVRFYDHDWHFRATKLQNASMINSITRIDMDVLRSPKAIATASVANRMSWAADRQTTREEDVAYCLLGVFDVHMPMMYGEGKRAAFVRLQEEIIKQTNDLTLFAWQATPASEPGRLASELCGILAHSPADFSKANDIEPSYDKKFNPEFSMTNKGLRISMPLKLSQEGRSTMMLNCYRKTCPDQQIGIHLEKHGPDLFARIRPHELADKAPRGMDRPSPVYISKEIYSVSRHAFRLQMPLTSRVKRTATYPEDLWDKGHQLHFTDGRETFVGYHHFYVLNGRNQLDVQRTRSFIGYPRVPDHTGQDEFVVVFGITRSERTWARIADRSSNPHVFEAIEKRDMVRLFEEGPRLQESKISLCRYTRGDMVYWESFSIQYRPKQGSLKHHIDIKCEPRCRRRPERIPAVVGAAGVGVVALYTYVATLGLASLCEYLVAI
ncbi:hypothetical protein ETB97_007131 [Aspergillus alliaceus]|uniref:Heterokaryon incompatibility domain-containing protein n=1 Tax=Petromyces alliaceus TaxID=209559 RepID=A0A8H6E257_PETAA|nr:hypothetical protein ETB97_007131 [Aspergillus burnettii]